MKILMRIYQNSVILRGMMRWLKRDLRLCQADILNL